MSEPNLTDKQFMKSFAKGVMSARGIDPEEYDIHISEKRETSFGSIVIFCSVMQFVLWYASGQFAHHTDTSSDVYWYLAISFQFIVYPFIFTLLRPKQMIKIVAYAIGMLAVSGILSFGTFLLDMIDRI